MRMSVLAWVAEFSFTGKKNKKGASPLVGEPEQAT